jgi:hypothetical protein
LSELNSRVGRLKLSNHHHNVELTKPKMPFSSINAEQLSIASCKVDGASPKAQPRVALVDAFLPHFSVITGEVANLEFGLDEASSCVDNSIITLAMLRRLKNPTDTTTRRKRELLLDNADRLTSKLKASSYRALCQLDDSEISDCDINDWESGL